MKRMIMALVLGVLMLGTPPALAQNDIEGFAAELVSLNRTPATRNPAFEPYQQVFALRILDTNRQWVGSVEDLKIDEGGLVAEVVGKINRIENGDHLVRYPVSQTEFLPPVSSFVVPLGGANADDSPEALAAIAPAAGNGGEVYSFRAMKGAEVLNTGGHYFGTVKEVLVDDEMQAVQALVLEDVPGARRYTEIAVPFDPEFVSINTRFDRLEFRLTPEAAQAVTDFARESR